jgi:hypothetical protein
LDGKWSRVVGEVRRLDVAPLTSRAVLEFSRPAAIDDGLHWSSYSVLQPVARLANVTDVRFWQQLQTLFAILLGVTGSAAATVMVDAWRFGAHRLERIALVQARSRPILPPHPPDEDVHVDEIAGSE